MPNENCGNFTIYFKNCTSGEIKVTRFEYKDGSKWRTENLFGLDGYQKLDEGATWPKTRDLGGIGDESTQFRVTYQPHIGGTKWGPAKCELTETFVAHDNGDKTVNIGP